MAGINDIKPIGPVWPTSAVKDRKPTPKRQPPQQEQEDDRNKDDDEPAHIDEYV